MNHIRVSRAGASSEKLTHNYDLLEQIAQAVYDNPYTAKAAPLPLVEVEEVERAADRERSQEFQDVIEMLGWPENPSEVGIVLKPLVPIDDNKDFLDAVTAPAHAPAGDRIDNFLTLVRYVPTMDAGDSSNFLEIYARSPSLHRFHVLLPELAQPLQLVIDDLMNRCPKKEDRDEELRLGMNNSIITALRQSYNLMGRLVTPSDKRLQYSLMWPGQDVTNIKDVTDARTELIS